MADALMLCPEAPYPMRGGGPLRTACLLEYLAARYTLDVITFREPGTADPRLAFPGGLVREVRVIDLPYHGRSAAARAARNARRFVAGAPPLVDRFSGFRLPLTRRYDLAVVEHFWCAGYVRHLRQHAARVVLDLHNVESVLLRRCAETEGAAGRMVFRRFAMACERMESALLPEFDLLLVPSELDRDAVGKGLVWPNAIPLFPRPDCLKRDEIVFSGNMAYHPNTAAAHWFASAIWPLVRDRHPGVIWNLVGKGPEALRLPGGDTRVRVTGPVEDALSALAPARAAVVPLLSGSGTRFKIVEAWAAGVPVVSTTIGAEGLGATDGVHLLLADSPASFADAVSSVLTEEVSARRLAEAGRALYEERFTWPVAWKVLESAGL